MTIRGFVLGKFMPLHQGHVFMCDVAAQIVDELTVLVCTRDCEPIDGALRASWVRACVPANARVVHLHRDVPQAPGDHPDFWSIWSDILNEHHPAAIDMVFGSEPYVMKLAEIAQAAPFIVDQDRTQVPVSATDIRHDPAAHWVHIPPVVRPYYQTRICLLGAESTGKSTLCETLGYHFVPEYGRSYDAQFRHGTGWTRQDFVNIATGHIALRKAIARRSGPMIVEDTDLVQTMAWADYLLGDVPQDLRDMTQDWTPADHYLVLSPDVPWTDDGTRYSGAAAVRQRFTDRLVTLLRHYDLPYSMVDGADWSARRQAVHDHCAGHIGAVISR